MSKISPPIRCSGGRIARRTVGRAARAFLAGPLLIIAIGAAHFDQMRIFVFLGAALFALMLFFFGVVVWSHCRWLEFDGLTLQGQRFWPFGWFDCPIQEIKKITAQTAKYGHEPDAHSIHFGKTCVWVTRDMENAAELLAAIREAMARLPRAEGPI